jgi:hypothetical protein
MLFLHCVRAAIIKDRLSRRDDGKDQNETTCGTGLKQQLCLGSERAFNKTVSQALGFEVAKRAVGSLSGLQEVTGHCGGVSSLRNERRDVRSTALGKEQKQLWYTPTGFHLIREPFRTSSLKEVAAGAVGE